MCVCECVHLTLHKLSYPGSYVYMRQLVTCIIKVFTSLLLLLHLSNFSQGNVCTTYLGIVLHHSTIYVIVVRHCYVNIPRDFPHLHTGLPLCTNILYSNHNAFPTCSLHAMYSDSVFGLVSISYLRMLV